MDVPCRHLIEGLETSCSSCGQPLCLRQQVLNLALGTEQDLLCLACLAKENGKTREEMLVDMGPYVLSRECFYKQWRLYKSDADCPDPLGCLPKNCFSFT
jgi:hypothetical protein